MYINYFINLKPQLLFVGILQVQIKNIGLTYISHPYQSTKYYFIKISLMIIFPNSKALIGLLKLFEAIIKNNMIDTLNLRLGSFKYLNLY